jgi:hypothetical protein
MTSPVRAQHDSGDSGIVGGRGASDDFALVLNGLELALRL